MPLPFLDRAGKKSGRGTAAAEADWARALAIIAAEYGDIPQSRRYVLARKVFKNITQGRPLVRSTHEMTMSCTTGGFSAAPLPVVTAGAPSTSTRRGAGRPRRKLAEALPLGDLAPILPDSNLVMVQNSAGYEAPDTNEDPEHSHWQDAGMIAAGGAPGVPAGTTTILGKKYVVFRAPGKLVAVRLDAVTGWPPVPPQRESVNEKTCAGYVCPKCKSKNTYCRMAHSDTSMEGPEYTCRDCKYSVEGDDNTQPQFERFEYDDGEKTYEEKLAAAKATGDKRAILFAMMGVDLPTKVNEATDELLTVDQAAVRPNVVRTARRFREQAREKGLDPVAYIDQILNEYDTPEKRREWAACADTVAFMRDVYRVALRNLSEAVAYTPQAIAIALKAAGIPLATAGARHEASGVEVVKVGDQVGWRWTDHAGHSNRHMGTVQVLMALEGIGYRSFERRAGDGSWVIVNPAAVQEARTRYLSSALRRLC